VSLFDQGQNQGYLDLYNLPTVPSDRSLQLWVQPTGSETFQNVGEIPSQFYGESGGVYYKLPAGTATPSQIMITIEPRATVPVAPTGAVVLRGP
jgi:anti-sigma-K factor RskA